MKNRQNLLTVYLDCAKPPRAAVVYNILDQGNSVNQVDCKSKGPLLHAAINEQTPLEVFSILIEKGAKVNQTDEYGRNALMWYLRWGKRVDVRVVWLFI